MPIYGFYIDSFRENFEEKLRHFSELFQENGPFLEIFLEIKVLAIQLCLFFLRLACSEVQIKCLKTDF